MGKKCTLYIIGRVSCDPGITSPYGFIVQNGYTPFFYLSTKKMKMRSIQIYIPKNKIIRYRKF